MTVTVFSTLAFEWPFLERANGVRYVVVRAALPD
ncbi:hypothetical protein ACVWYF_000005 [Hymenobacter sp. UYAg731]